MCSDTESCEQDITVLAEEFDADDNNPLVQSHIGQEKGYGFAHSLDGPTDHGEVTLIHAMTSEGNTTSAQNSDDDDD